MDRVRYRSVLILVFILFGETYFSTYYFVDFEGNDNWFFKTNLSGIWLCDSD